MKRRWAVLFVASLVSILLSGMAGRSARAESPIGRRIESFSLQDYRGKPHKLDDYADRRLVVVAFLGTECPLAKLYAPRLAELAREYESKGVAFLALDSNQQDSITEIAAYAQRHELTVPMLKDTGNSVADRFGAERTPEVFVLDDKRVIRYWGRIDDQFGIQANGVAYQRTAPLRRDLAEALDELLAGREVSQSVVAATGCRIGRTRQPRTDSDVTYSNQIARLMNQHCVVCHRAGQIAPFSLTSYDEAVGWAEMIREVVAARRMPPWHADPNFGRFSNDARLSDEEMTLISRWVEAGAPRGNPSELPAPPQFASGWLIPEPDEVIYACDEPFSVPAEGPMPYQHFTVDPGWTEDRWIKAIEPKSGNPSVVHHIVIYLLTPRNPPSGPAGRIKNVLLTATAPGVRPHIWEEGLAQYIPAGSKLVFEMHYTPNGSVQQDRSSAGILFADPKTVKKEVAVQVAGNTTFRIPPHESAHQVESFYTFREDSLLLSLSPHMHLRGKDYRYDLQYPDGKTETVLSVPQYDFGWQTTYVLAEPKVLPKGTKMHCVAHYDNSDDNLANPDPGQQVRFGEQTWEEMMFGWFDMALVDQDLTQPQEHVVTRTERFVRHAQEGTVEPDDELHEVARRALRSAEDFELLATRLQDLVPQLDRVCVTYVEDGKLRVREVAELTPLRTPLGGKGAIVEAAQEDLAGYVAKNEAVVNADLSQAAGSVIQRMVRRGVRSSLHVPAKLGGTTSTANFWSTEAAAFPPAAVDLLRRVVQWMAEP